MPKKKKKKKKEEEEEKTEQVALSLLFSLEVLEIIDYDF
jgi:hypothetical protein